MVSRAEVPNLRLASCWRVEVVKGGDGLRVAGFSSVLLTCHNFPDKRSFNAIASASLSRTTFFP